MSEPTTITLTPEQDIQLSILLNLALRRRLAPEVWHELNGIFRQLAGRDHDGINRYLTKVTG